ncbi:thiol-disulfide oxidoreductase DCC family protein [Bacillaceae bacterium]
MAVDENFTFPSGGGTELLLTKNEERVILFDGTCHFCNAWVRFVILRDRRETFRFAALRSHIGETLLQAYGVPRETDSVILLEKDRYFKESEAVLRICKNLGAPWKWLYLFIHVPAPIRDAVYRWVPGHRFRFFRRENACPIPTENMRKRFLDAQRVK